MVKSFQTDIPKQTVKASCSTLRSANSHLVKFYGVIAQTCIAGPHVLLLNKKVMLVTLCHLKQVISVY